jgi:hypothetical protein
MRVLDLGCGAGDVSMLAGELVGASGSVVGIDPRWRRCPPHYAWLADTTRTFLPQMVQIGVATAESVAIETLESRLRSAVVEARSQVEGPAQVCAWTSI